MKTTRLLCVVACLLLGARGNVCAQTTPDTETFPVNINVNASKTLGEMKPVWRFFGADEPNYAYMKDGRKLLAELGELRPGSVYFRTHNLLTTGDGTPALKWGSTNAYTEWRRMGSPPQPTPQQYAQLERAGRLAQLSAPQTVMLKDSAVTLRLTLPRQAVSLLVLEWGRSSQTRAGRRGL